MQGFLFTFDFPQSKHKLMTEKQASILDLPETAILIKTMSLQMAAFQHAIKTHYPEAYHTYLLHFEEARKADTELRYFQQLLEVAKDLDIASSLPMPSEGQS